ncbi:MAG: hypothetical protein Q8S17_02400, partial [Humidesulfovibrio sp.]|nr:hypothetical protein [Humidesulfovibrio sp.]
MASLAELFKAGANPAGQAFPVQAVGAQDLCCLATGGEAFHSKGGEGSACKQPAGVHGREH